MQVHGVPETSDAAADAPLALTLHHVAVVVADQARSIEFYTSVFGFRVHETKPNWLLLDDYAALHLMEIPGTAPHPDRYPMAHIALRVESLEAARDRVLALGLEPWQNSFEGSREIVDDSESLDWGIGTLFVRDPDGNAIELIQAQRGIFAEHKR